MYLELKHLRTLSELHEAGSLSRTAERLHLTQSALSHQVKALEEHLGQALFERKSRPLRLTPAGARLLELAQRVLPEVARAETDLLHMAQGAAGRLHIVLECHSCFDWLLPAMDSYRGDWPEVELDLSTSMSFDALPALSAGKVDLVITSDPIEDPDLGFQPLFRFEILLAVPRSHPLAARGHVEPQDLSNETLITYPVAPSRLDVFRRFLDPAGVAPACVRTSELSIMIVELVKSGRGLAVLPSWVLAPALEQRQIAAPPLGRTGVWSKLYAATRTSDQGLAYLDAFMETVRRTALRTLAIIEPA